MQVVRGQDWWFYKIPPLLAVGYASMLLFPSPPGPAIIALSGVLLAICAVACFGYIVNDLFDIAQDRRSGKSNTMADRSLAARVVFVVLPIAAAFILIRLGAGGPAAPALLAANFMLPALYSIPPIRLKERALLGVLADAGAAHLLPTALVVTSVTPASDQNGPLFWLLLASACGWAFFAGLRGIIVHQVADADADASAGVRTFGSRLGASRARAMTFRLLVPVEVLALAAFLGILVAPAPVIGVVALAYAALEMLKMRAKWVLPLFERQGVSTERYLPLLNNEFYEMWLPIGLALQLTITDPRYLPLLAFQIIAFLPTLLIRGGVLRRLLLPA
jgi:4-hydroxybenzoate polyprenyltransferase